MLVYLPERIYFNVFKDDKKFDELTQNATKMIFTNDLVQSMFDYEYENKYIVEIDEYIKSKLPEAYKKEYELLTHDDLSVYEKDYESLDTESKLYLLYAFDSGNMAPSKEVRTRNIKYIKLYDEFVKNNPKPYSNILHVVYYSKVYHEKLLDIRKNGFTLDIMRALLEYEERLYKECVSRASDERFYQMAYAKREQMLVLTFLMLGQFTKQPYEAYKMIMEHIINKRFKYNLFTYYRCYLSLQAFMILLDKGDLNGASDCWKTLTERINWAFSHKEYAIKSLNHYNKAFLDEFLDMTRFIKKIDDMRDHKSLKIMDKLVGKEVDFFNDKIDKKLLSKYISKDPSYTKGWVEPKKMLINMI